MKETTNIAAIASYKIYPAQSGGQKGIALFYKYLSAILPVTIISVDGNDDPVGDQIRLEAMLGSSKLRYINPILFFRLKKFIKQNNITHLILEHPYYGWLGRMLKFSCKVKLIVHSHNIESLRFKSTGKWWWPILWQYERKTHQSADFSFFITENDRRYALDNFGLDDNKCSVITYGTEIGHAPTDEERRSAKQKIAETHGLKENTTVLLFNGFFDYAPNLRAVDDIVQSINPLLLQEDFDYKIFICGKNLPAYYDELKAYADKKIIYPGFVPDIQLYFKAADIFINPVTDGGGIKTKLVEALSNNLSAVSTANGAAGIPADITGNKLKVVADGDNAAFCEAIKSIDIKERISAEFFEHFYWGNVAAKAAAKLNSI